MQQEAYSEDNGNENLQIKPLTPKEEILKKLTQEDLSEENKNILLHVLNILGGEPPFTRGQMPCAYYGRFKDQYGINYDSSSTNNLERCLALELNERKENTCPFYKKEKEGQCSYIGNKRLL